MSVVAARLTSERHQLTSCCQEPFHARKLLSVWPLTCDLSKLTCTLHLSAYYEANDALVSISKCIPARQQVTRHGEVGVVLGIGVHAYTCEWKISTNAYSHDYMPESRIANSLAVPQTTLRHSVPTMETWKANKIYNCCGRNNCTAIAL